MINLTQEQFNRLKLPRKKRTITISRIRTNKAGKIKELVVPEKAILGSILEYLWHEGYFVWRNNSGTVQTKWDTYVKLGPSGSADIIGLTPWGRFIAIETKTAKGKQRFSQEIFEQRIKDNHGIYILARNVSELIEALLPLDKSLVSNV